MYLLRPMAKKTFKYTESEAYQVQILAREEMKLKLLNDITLDMQICQIEGWNHKIYIRELIQLLKEVSSDGK